MNRANKIYAMMCFAQACVWGMHPAREEVAHRSNSVSVNSIESFREQFAMYMDPENQTIFCYLKRDHYPITLWEEILWIEEETEGQPVIFKDYRIDFEMSSFAYWTMELDGNGVVTFTQVYPDHDIGDYKDAPDFAVEILEGRAARYNDHGESYHTLDTRVGRTVSAVSHRLGLPNVPCIIIFYDNQFLAMLSPDLPHNHFIYLKEVGPGRLQSVNKQEESTHIRDFLRSKALQGPAIHFDVFDSASLCQLVGFLKGRAADTTEDDILLCAQKPGSSFNNVPIWGLGNTKLNGPYLCSLPQGTVCRFAHEGTKTTSYWRIAHFPFALVRFNQIYYDQIADIQGRNEFSDEPQFKIVFSRELPPEKEFALQDESISFTKIGLSSSASLPQELQAAYQQEGRIIWSVLGFIDQKWGCCLLNNGDPCYFYLKRSGDTNELSVVSSVEEATSCDESGLSLYF